MVVCYILYNILYIFKYKNDYIYNIIIVAGSGQQSLRVVAEDENKCTDHSRPVEKKGGCGTLLR